MQTKTTVETLDREQILRMARAAGLVRTHAGMAPEVVAFAHAVAAATRAEILREGDAADWGAAYDEFRAGTALPNDAPALQYAFVAGMHFERRSAITGDGTGQATPEIGRALGVGGDDEAK